MAVDSGNTVNYVYLLFDVNTDENNYYTFQLFRLTTTKQRLTLIINRTVIWRVNLPVFAKNLLSILE